MLDVNGLVLGILLCEKIELKAQRIAQEDAENEAVHV